MATGIVNPYAVVPGGGAYRNAVLADNPLVLLMLDEPYGDDVAVNQGSLGSSHNGIYNGTLSTDSNYRNSGTIFGLECAGRRTGSSTTVGFYDGSVTFPPTGSSAIWPNASTSAATFSFEYLYRRQTNVPASTWEYTMFNWYPFYLWSYGNNQHAFTLRSSNGTAERIGYGTASNLPRYTDHHVVWTFGAERCVTYINGAYQRAYTWPTSPAFTGVQPGAGAVYIGNLGNGSTKHFRGQLAGLAVHDNELSQAQVTAHYNALL